MLYYSRLLPELCERLREFDLMDRTGHFHSMDNITVLQPYRSTPDPSLSFDDVCQQRAKDIISQGKKINLFWSGGSDSTLTLLLLQQQGIDPDQLRILTSNDSLKANPVMAMEISRTYEIDSPRLHPEGLRYFMDDQQWVLSGTGMDMLTCGFEVQRTDCDTLDELVQWLQETTQTKATKEDYQAVFEGLSKAADMPCTTVAEYSRLKNLILCWQPELLGIGRMSGFGEYGRHYLNFYQTPEFVAWSLAQPVEQLAVLDRWGNKQMSVDAIVQRNPNVVPRQSCPQTKSMLQLYRLGPEIIKITDNWQYITHEATT